MYTMPFRMSTKAFGITGSYLTISELQNYSRQNIRPASKNNCHTCITLFVRLSRNTHYAFFRVKKRRRHYSQFAKLLVCAGSVVPVAMSSTSCCNCTFQDTQFLAGSCGASFTLFMGLVEYLVRSQDDIADSCNRSGRDRVKVSAMSSLLNRKFKNAMSI